MQPKFGKVSQWMETVFFYTRTEKYVYRYIHVKNKLE